jgi:aldehyde:ferredoxin oxidoreductase
MLTQCVECPVTCPKRMACDRCGRRLCGEGTVEKAAFEGHFATAEGNICVGCYPSNGLRSNQPRT